MPAAPQTLSATLRFGRILWFILFASQLLYTFGSNRLLRQMSANHPIPPHSFVIGMTYAALFETALGVIFYVRLVRRSGVTLASDPTDALVLRKWRQGMILACTMAEAAVLTGFAVRAQGALPTQSFPISALGLIAMLFFFPKTPTN